jgi:hypothetical protein
MTTMDVQDLMQQLLTDKPLFDLSGQDRCPGGTGGIAFYRRIVSLSGGEALPMSFLGS